MDDENIKNIVNFAVADNVNGMKDAFYDSINDRIFDALEQRKREIASNLIAQYDTQEGDDDGEGYEEQEGEVEEAEEEE